MGKVRSQQTMATEFRSMQTKNKNCDLMFIDGIIHHPPPRGRSPWQNSLRKIARRPQWDSWEKL
jgi:hypothetical protein